MSNLLGCQTMVKKLAAALCAYKIILKTYHQLQQRWADGQLVSGTGCSVNGSRSLPTRDTDGRFSV